MVLKIQDYEKSKHGKYDVESWTYLDKIVCARNFFNEDIKETEISCTFADGNIITFVIPYVAYLMSDDGKTIDRICAAKKNAKPDEEAGMTLQDALRAAMDDES